MLVAPTRRDGGGVALHLAPTVPLDPFRLGFGGLATVQLPAWVTAES
jgi:hypothetical protein